MAACKCGNTLQLLQGPFAGQLCKIVKDGEPDYPLGCTGPQVVCIGGGTLVSAHHDTSVPARAAGASASSAGTSINPATVSIQFANEDGTTPQSFAAADPAFIVNGAKVQASMAFSLYKDLKLFDTLTVEHIVQICMAYDSPSDADIKSLETKFPEIYNPWEKAIPESPQELISFLHKSDPYAIHSAFAAASTALRTIAKFRTQFKALLAADAKITKFISKLAELLAPIEAARIRTDSETASSTSDAMDQESTPASASALTGSSGSSSTSASASASATAAPPAEVDDDSSSDKEADDAAAAGSASAASAASAARSRKTPAGKSRKSSVRMTAASSAAVSSSVQSSSVKTASSPKDASVDGLKLLNEAIELLTEVSSSISNTVDPSSGVNLLDTLTTSVLNLLSVPLTMHGATLFHPIIKKYKADRTSTQAIPLLRRSKVSPTDPPEIVGSGDWLTPFLFDCAKGSLPSWKRRILQDGRDLAQHLTLEVTYDDMPGHFTDFKTAMEQIGFWHTMSSRSPAWLSFSEQYFNHLRTQWDQRYNTHIAAGDNLAMWNSLMRYHTTLRSQGLSITGTKTRRDEDSAEASGAAAQSGKVVVKDCTGCHAKFPVPPGRHYKQCSTCHHKTLMAQARTKE